MVDKRKRWSKGGRPRKLDAPRYSNGRLIRDNEPMATPELMARRVALVGEALAMSETPGRASALLKHWGVIGERQAEALEKYRAAAIEYRIMRCIPRSVARIVSLGVAPEPCQSEEEEKPPSPPDLEDEARAYKAKARMEDLWKEIAQVEFPLLARELLEMFAIEDVTPPAWRDRSVGKAALLTLLQTLERIADYFELAKDEKTV